MIDPLLRPIGHLKVCVALEAAGATDAVDTAANPDEAEPGLRCEMRLEALAAATQLSTNEATEVVDGLVRAGYATQFHEYGSARRGDTIWVTLSRKGQRALADHEAALREIASEAS